MSPKNLTALDICARAQDPNAEKIVMVTAYDASFARILDAAGVDILLVGDSLGMVVQGADNTLGVTLDDMVYHSRAVARGSQRALIVADLPFMSYQVSPEQGLQSAGRLIQEGQAHAVKLEGGKPVAATCQRIVQAGIPVMGHIGLTPQSIHHLGGFRVQGRDAASAQRLLEDAQALENAGAFSIVLEGVPTELAQDITERLTIPTIGIGAGQHCGGQVLVCYDFLGMNPDFKPKFLKTYENLHDRIHDACKCFIEDVRNQAFPAAEHSFHTPSLRVVDAVKKAGEAG